MTKNGKKDSPQAAYLRELIAAKGLDGADDPALAFVQEIMRAASSGGHARTVAEIGESALRKSEYSAEAMNAEFAHIILGKNAMVVWDRPGADDRDGIRLITLEAFHSHSANAKEYYEDEKGKTRSITYAAKWVADPDRRDYAGMEFFPNPDGASGRHGFLNLWRGFSVKASRAGSCKIFLDHLRTNVCDGNEDLFRWLFGWFAQIVQQPRSKPGTSVVLRGGMGYGKSIVGEVIGSLFANHYVLADDARYLTGNFNSHMASCLLLQADEAVWAGDKAAEGRLKGLVTSSFQMIEGKGIDPVRMDNHLRVLMTSNNDWVVPAGKDERRFAIFDVSPYAAQNHGYFGELVAEIEAGGRERLLFELLTFDISTVNLREIPKTAALLDQKLHSLDPIDAWWLDRLQAGTPTRKHASWPDFVPTRALVDDYYGAADRVGVHRKAFETQVGTRFSKLVPGAKRLKRVVAADEPGTTERVWGYDLPTLEEAREAFEASLGQVVAWGSPDG